MPIGATIAGGGIIGSAILGSSSAKKASKAQVAAQREAQATQKANLEAITGMLTPYTGIGESAISSLRAMIEGGPNSAEMMRQLEAYPGYQFAMGQGQNALDAQIAKMGSLSGNQIAGALEYATGMGSQLFEKYFGNLTSLANIGMGAVGTRASAMMNTSNNIANSQIAQGDARANGILGASAAWQNGIGQLTKLAGGVAGQNPASWLNNPISSIWSSSSSGGITPMAATAANHPGMQRLPGG